MSTSAQEFAGECIAVTGAARGIGAAVTHLLLERGASVIALDLDVEGLTQLSQSEYSDRVSCHLVDISQADAVDAALAQGQEKLGPIHRLACVAGVLQMGRITELSNEQWDRTFAINTTGVFNVCRNVAKGMIERKQGAIVNVSSNSAATPRIAMGAYAASKAAVTQLSRCLGLELAPHSIRVNIISPGSTDTPMQQAMWAQGSSRETVIAGSGENYRLGIPLQKIATPEEIAEAVLFLLSDRASHITLSDLRVDGGATLDQG